MYKAKSWPTALRTSQIVAGVLLLFIIMWPVASQYAFIHDEHKFCIWSLDGSVASNIRLMWSQSQYRVLDLIAGYLCNPWTLDARWTVLIQLPALILLAIGIQTAAQRLCPNNNLVAPLALIWFSLHTATSVAFWIPTVGQTWSAAAGCWLGLLTWQAFRNLSNGATVSGRTWLLLLLLALFAPHLKETYYGWVFAVTIALVIAWATLTREQRNRAPLRHWLTLVLAISLLPFLHMLARMVFGGLGAFADPAAGRYHAQFGINLLKNFALSVAGELAVTPVHYFRRHNYMPLIALAGLLLFGAFVVAALRHFRLRAGDARSSQSRQCALILVTSLLSVTVTWPMGRISELYLMGPNAAVAVVAAIGSLELWYTVGLNKRRLARLAAISSFAVGLLGLISRAIHIRKAWLDGRTLYAQAETFQATLAPSPISRTIGVPRYLTQGWQHSQYVMPPANALNPQSVQIMLNELRPTQKIKFRVVDTSSDSYDYLLDGSKLQSEPLW